ncbi:MAG: Hsp70 family protein [Terrimicrobiaceae bacterium]|nr:Hsp70 family protein [Terrimicrobiaceae bacterium]
MIVGIDLGTTHSLVGSMQSGFPVLVADEDGERLTPSAVWFPAEGEPVVGREALAHRLESPGRVVTSVKRLMGMRNGEQPDLPYSTGAGNGTGVGIFVGGRSWSPEEVSSLILKKLKSEAERSLAVPVDRAVITVPAYFNDAQRAATKRAGELAGFSVERIVSEPTAAALAYGLDRLGEKSKVAVYDLGGGTFDVSILLLSSGVFEVLSTNGDTRLGGDDLDAALAAAWNLPPQTAEKIKRALSESDELVHEGTTYTRAGLEAVCRPIIARTRKNCIRSLADANLESQELDAVILVGGATRMPLVRDFVAEVFGRAPDTSQHPDEAVALGATIQAGILSGDVRSVTLLDVTPLSLGIETFGGLMNVIIPRNTTIPCKAGEMFTNAVGGQSGMRITVLQGEREMAKDNWKLGEFDVGFAPLPKGRARVGVQFELDANGILNVLARDTATGTDTVVKMRSAVEVSDEAVEKMLGDSLEHAFEDMGERVLTEARLKADEMLPAVEAALLQLGPEVTDEERAALSGLIGDVRHARAEKSAPRLKAALAALDEATQPLATRLIEKALGEKS